MKYGYNTKPLMQRKNRKYNNMQCIQYKKATKYRQVQKKKPNWAFSPLFAITR